eukprot:CAMPEP_0203816020 /NCGR_PEP_ID=MMETSP0115-20131106/14296_1 /ASSEMBLY_ACC=CAM_ASM_000227 /TAXON_ID=33651 /ORGANISM="Bicosoecid sp, Strain ms1" /LENGTH=432 /DNA_ID=CAMNT_0050724917 /DNA_START=133 /DNA_END=1431 /DNA_ORIENTATION=-
MTRRQQALLAFASALTLSVLWIATTPGLVSPSSNGDDRVGLPPAPVGRVPSTRPLRIRPDSRPAPEAGTVDSSADSSGGDGAGHASSSQQAAADAAPPGAARTGTAAGDDVGSNHRPSSLQAAATGLAEHPWCRRRRPDMVVFNRLPKCGSATVMRVLHSLPHPSWYRETSDDAHNHRRYSESALVRQVETKFVEPRRSARGDAQRPFGFFQSHQFFTDYSTLYDGSVATINVVRHPVDRCVSEYYWIISKMFDRSTVGEYALKDVNQCARDGCFDASGSRVIETPYFDASVPGPDGQRWMKQLMLEVCNNYLVRWFCGHADVCMDPSSDEALHRAEDNIRNRHVSVGVMEDFTTTFQVFDWLLPAVFGGASATWTTQSWHEHNASYVAPNAETLELLTRLNKADLRLYEAIRHRLRAQAETCLPKAASGGP